IFEPSGAVRRSLSRTLERWGVPYKAAGTAPEVLELMEEETRPTEGDTILADDHLWEGIQHAWPECGERTGKPSLVCMHTAGAMRNRDLEAHGSACGWLIKPVRPSRLRAFLVGSRTKALEVSGTGKPDRA